jgi:biofilm PGA synthesis protein PgaA
LTAQTTPDDHWTLGFAYALRTLDVPIAAVVVGVHADRFALNADYRVSESRDFGALAIHEGYSDGNSRSELLAYFRERWITGPIYKLDTRLDLDASRNTLAGTNYFNPKRDETAAVTLQNQWLQFRRYESSLTHELDVGFGDYLEQGYGQGAIALLRYQAVYQVNRRVMLKAGAGTGIRPYDGRRETLDVLTFKVEGRF